MMLVYLSCVPLTPKVARDWYLDYLISAGVGVEFWDITRLLRGSITEHYAQQANYVREFSDLPLLEAAIFDRKDAVYVLLIPEIWAFRSVFRLLSKYHCLTVCIKWGAMPTMKILSRLPVLRLFLSPRSLLTKIRNRIMAALLSQAFYMRPYNLVFAAGQVTLDKQALASRTIPIALCDYDQYTKSLASQRIVSAKYAVFLDVYLPFHSDFALVGMHLVDPVAYFADLNRFLALVERRYGLEVVIAMHPKSRYVGNEFNGRQLVSGRTAELVRHSEIVICHVSTSVSYAVLNCKVIWTIYTDEMQRLYADTFMHQIRALALSLRAPMLNVSRLNEADLPTLVPPDEFCYEAYKNDFVVTPGIKGGESKQIFLREITALRNERREF